MTAIFKALYGSYLQHTKIHSRNRFYLIKKKTFATKKILREIDLKIQNFAPQPVQQDFER